MNKNGPSPSHKPDPIASSGFFVLRAPALPFSAFQAWSDGLEATYVDVRRTLTCDRRFLKFCVVCGVGPEIM